eukprot:scaffold1467_cov135-Skeletonema_marinoi.AAC.3
MLTIKSKFRCGESVPLLREYSPIALSSCKLGMTTLLDLLPNTRSEMGSSQSFCIPSVLQMLIIIGMAT